MRTNMNMNRSAKLPLGILPFRRSISCTIVRRLVLLNALPQPKFGSGSPSSSSRHFGKEHPLWKSYRRDNFALAWDVRTLQRSLVLQAEIRTLLRQWIKAHTMVRKPLQASPYSTRQHHRGIEGRLQASPRARWSVLDGPSLEVGSLHPADLPTLNDLSAQNDASSNQRKLSPTRFRLRRAAMTTLGSCAVYANLVHRLQWHAFYRHKL